MLETAAETDDLRAVVSEGAGRAHVRRGVRAGLLGREQGAQRLGIVSRTPACGVFGDEPPPADLETSSGGSPRGRCC